MIEYYNHGDLIRIGKFVVSWSFSINQFILGLTFCFNRFEGAFNLGFLSIEWRVSG